MFRKKIKRVKRKAETGGKAKVDGEEEEEDEDTERDDLR